MVLGEMIGVEARAVEQLDDRQPLFVIIRQRRRAAIEMVEDSEFHRRPRYLNIVGTQPAKPRGRMRSSQGFGGEARAWIDHLVLRLDQRHFAPPASAVRLRMPNTDAAARDIASAAEPVRR